MSQISDAEGHGQTPSLEAEGHGQTLSLEAEGHVGLNHRLLQGTNGRRPHDWSRLVQTGVRDHAPRVPHQYTTPGTPPSPGRTPLVVHAAVYGQRSSAMGSNMALRNSQMDLEVILRPTI